ncbi:effector binding domain-containing protein [Sphaerochaeta globosa]|uniref:Transcription activator effector binding protein n=1 Tax=Sphaerochaeta globosa (strain ATCC BAA-1886 / DSM 22777 / Buddy) TaxID=158189 RepID=F0RRV4_SPHGB|nr:effector binding domain-containing protein [Sphaerochaeta globosa]ADY14559.1 transcription activator effector binding protein [Sphaerochaeta globosa str. Buddy]
MNGYDTLVETLSRFEHSLASLKPITTVGELAKESGYSVHHFSRLFFSHTSLHVKEYLQGRLLTSIFEQAATDNAPFATLAALYGFRDYETFYRACKTRWDKNPTQIREQGLAEEQKQQRIYPQRKEPTITLVGELVQKEAINLCGLSFFVGPETKTFHTIWAQFSRYEHLIEHTLEEGTTYQYSSWADEPMPGMSVLCAKAIEEAWLEEELFTIRKVPPATYVRFVHTQDVMLIQEAYQYIYGTYFARSPLQPLGNWEFQRYPQGRSEIEIYIPVRTGTPLPS